MARKGIPGRHHWKRKEKDDVLIPIMRDRSRAAKVGWSKFSKEERTARIKKAWITRKKDEILA